MIVKEDGPAFIFLRFRTLLGVVETEEGLNATNIVGLIFTCPLCLCVWLAIPLTLLLHGSWLEWLAMSGAARALFRFTERD